ncbi:hypothetical protein ACP70R_046829 [Stipagrostis hirtigluma subsp. patula]
MEISMSDTHGHSTSDVLLATQPDVQCLVCTRPFTLDTEVTDSFEALAICRECKTTVLGDHNRAETTSTSRERRRRRPRSRATRHEPIEDSFSEQFSQLINLARQGQDVDIDSPSVPHQQASYNSTQNRSLRFHASDDESDGLNYVDSVFGEIESNVSFGDYGGESDASLDQHTTMGREIFIQLDSESYMNTDTDIDPMNAGMDQWDSDDQEHDEDEQSEESGFGEAVGTMQQHHQWLDVAPGGLNELESEDVIRNWRIYGNQGVNMTNLRADTEQPESRRLFIGNPGDYVDARQFEMLLEQFSEDNNTRRGAPPTAASFVQNLPFVVISTCHETNGGVICPVCKDHMPIRTIAKQLPCTHLYHSSCILPWLGSRNTCPVCRYELPTDDPEYERSKRITTNERDTHDMGQIQQQEGVEETSIVEGTHNGAVLETSTTEHAAQQPNGEHGRTRWFFIAAAPVVSLVGLALVFCFTNPAASGRRQPWRRSHSASSAHLDTKRTLSHLLHLVCLRPGNIRNKLRRQGVMGPKPNLLYGNTREMKRIQQELKPVKMQYANNCMSIVFPHIPFWRKTYGPTLII